MNNINAASPELLGATRVLTIAAAPVNGTDEVQTLTIGGTPTGGTFRLSFEGVETGDITWSSTNNTLRDNVDAALESLATIGTGGVATAVGTMTSGVGTLTITFGANLGKLAVPTIAVASIALTGTSPTVAVAETTPGVTATARGCMPGTLLVRTDAGNVKTYQNTGTSLAPVWTALATA